MVLKGVLRRLKKSRPRHLWINKKMSSSNVWEKKNMASVIVNSITFQFTNDKRYGAKQERYA